MSWTSLTIVKYILKEIKVFFYCEFYSLMKLAKKITVSADCYDQLHHTRYYHSNIFPETNTCQALGKALCIISHNLFPLKVTKTIGIIFLRDKIITVGDIVQCLFSTENNDAAFVQGTSHE